MHIPYDNIVFFVSFFFLQRIEAEAETIKPQEPAHTPSSLHLDRQARKRKKSIPKQSKGHAPPWEKKGRVTASSLRATEGRRRLPGQRLSSAAVIAGRRSSTPFYSLPVSPSSGRPPIRDLNRAMSHVYFWLECYQVGSEILRSAL